MTYLISDIHANIKELTKLTTYLNIQKNDTLVFLGDYIDKNIYTQETLKLLNSLEQKCQCLFIKGNHEFVWDKYLNYHELTRQNFLLTHGGVESLRQFSNQPEKLLRENKVTAIKKYLAPYLNLMPKMIDYVLIDKYLAAHAGLKRDQIMEKRLKFTETNYFLRPEQMDWQKHYLNKYTVVAGHTYLKTKPTIKNGYINIDLGAGYHKYLGALWINKNIIIRSDGLTFKI